MSTNHPRTLSSIAPIISVSTITANEVLYFYYFFIFFSLFQMICYSIKGLKDRVNHYPVEISRKSIYLYSKHIIVSLDCLNRASLV